MNVTHENATLDISFGNTYDEDPHGDGTPGFGGHFEVNRKRYAALYEEYQFQRYSIDEDSTSYDEEEHDEDDTVCIPLGDDFIVFASSVGIDGGKWDIYIDGNPYWIFHDLDHASYDCSGGSVDIDQQGYAEDRALVNGATAARENGISLAVIFKELAQVLKPFEERFSRSTDAIERFAESLDE